MGRIPDFLFKRNGMAFFPVFIDAFFTEDIIFRKLWFPGTQILIEIAQPLSIIPPFRKGILQTDTSCQLPNPVVFGSAFRKGLDDLIIKSEKFRISPRFRDIFLFKRDYEKISVN